MATDLSAQRLMNLNFFLLFSYYNFENTFKTNFENDMYRIESLTNKVLNVQFSLSVQ